MRKTIYVCDCCGIEVSEHKLAGWVSIHSDSDISIQICLPNQLYSDLGLAMRFINLDNTEFCSGLCLVSYLQGKINGHPV